jgi:hypothetical protein
MTPNDIDVLLHYHSIAEPHGCTYTLDGRSILWAGEPEVRRVNGVLTASRRIELFGREGKSR